MASPRTSMNPKRWICDHVAQTTHNQDAFLAIIVIRGNLREPMTFLKRKKLGVGSSYLCEPCSSRPMLRQGACLLQCSAPTALSPHNNHAHNVSRKWGRCWPHDMNVFFRLSSSWQCSTQWPHRTCWLIVDRWRKIACWLTVDWWWRIARQTIYLAHSVRVASAQFSMPPCDCLFESTLIK